MLHIWSSALLLEQSTRYVSLVVVRDSIARVIAILLVKSVNIRHIVQPPVWGTLAISNALSSYYRPRLGGPANRCCCLRDDQILDNGPYLGDGCITEKKRA
jgi:hypothetical protein